ncbi:MAG: 4-hydroxy-tetrahydrodipicolinate reductase [bacterium]
MLKLCVVGGLGRMGHAMAAIVEKDKDFSIVSVLEAEEAARSCPDYAVRTGYSKNEVLLTADAAAALGPADVVVDFSLPAGFDALLAGIANTPRPLVTGTTGVDDKEDRLASIAEKAAVVSAPNMSVGVNILFALSGLVAGLSGEAADIEIIETHHRFKKDVPSGTAIEIARRIGKATGKEVKVGRGRGTQERGGEVFIHSIRTGGVAGEHEVSFSLEGEVLKIDHMALSRECFAAGALKAARFAADAAPGIYSMLDVLKLISRER